jgi:hypothetical protein
MGQLTHILCMIAVAETRGQLDQLATSAGPYLASLPPEKRSIAHDLIVDAIDAAINRISTQPRG